MIAIAGLILMLLGFFAGAVLVASALGIVTITSPVALWILFPIASGLGLLLAALGSRTRSLPWLLKLTGSVMLLLSLASVVSIVLAASGLMNTARGTAALWYVFAVGLVIGTANFLAPASPGEPV